MRFDLAACAAAGLEHLHKHDVLHLDIKPENVLLAAPPLPAQPLQLKIGDFGLAVVSSRWEVQEGAPRLSADSGACAASTRVPFACIERAPLVW